MAYSYLLIHKATGRLYYGIRLSYKGEPHDDLWKKYFSSSKEVKKIRQQEGDDAFEAHIRVIGTKEFIIRLEGRVLRRFNVTQNDRWINKNYSINGFITYINTGHSAETRKKLSEKRSRGFVLYDSDNRRIEGTNVKQFCKDNRLSSAAIFRVINGQKLVFKGYRLSLDTPTCLPNREVWCKSYTIYDTDNNVVQVNNLRQFCKDNNLSYTNMNKVVNGTQVCHKGYRIKPNLPNSHGLAKKFRFLLNNNIVEVENLSKYCRDNNLNYNNLAALSQGRSKISQGHTLID